MKSWLKFGLQMFVGGVFGYLGMYAYLNNELIQIDLTAYELPMMILLTLLLIGLFTWALSRYQLIRRLLHTPLAGEEEDEAEGIMYRAYSDGTLASTLTTIFSLVSMSLTLLSDQSLWFLLFNFFTLLGSFVLSYAFNALLPVMYPDRTLPKLSNPDYAQRLLELSDDGEKHVMLQGLYRTNITSSALMIFAIIVLLAYSLMTGDSQLFSIFVLSFIMVFTNIQYIRIIRTKN